jgi:plastocyanin
MRRLRGKQGLLIGIIGLGLVAAACGNNASASTNGTTTPTPTPSPSPSMAPSPSTSMPPSNTVMRTVVEGPGDSFAFMPSTITVKQGATLKLDNVSDTAHTFTVTGQSIDVETQPGQTSQVTIDLPPGSYPFICRFHQSLGMTGTLVVKA